jgi:FkbM family methyltransferase
MGRSAWSKLADNRVTRPVKWALVRELVSKSASRRVLNRWYSTLGDEAVARFYNRYAKLFTNSKMHVEGGLWHVTFAGREIRLPLRAHLMWLDWDNAVSILGHDIEVKRTYAALLAQAERPALFLDVGANYGMHSALFLSAGVPTITFEPNPSCRPCFEEVCELNGYEGRWESVALGSKGGEVELAYPERETWLGTVAESGTCRNNGHAVAVQRVQMRRLDDYLSIIPAAGALLKIDVEGSELNVFRGASRVLELCKPKVIFESLDGNTRAHLYQLLRIAGYMIHRLPWLPFGSSKPFTMDEFVQSRDNNFIAVVERSEGEAPAVGCASTPTDHSPDRQGNESRLRSQRPEDFQQSIWGPRVARLRRRLMYRLSLTWRTR